MNDDDEPQWGLPSIMRRLEEMAREVAEEGGDVPPTSHALHLARRTLTDAVWILATTAPNPEMSPNGDGGIYLYWKKPGCSLKLTIPSSIGQQPNYYSKIDGVSSWSDASPHRLAAALKAFI